MPHKVVVGGEILTPEDVALPKYQRVLFIRASLADGILLDYQQALFPSEWSSVR